MAKRVVIGFGNPLMGDDAAGLHVLAHLAGMMMPPDVELMDGGVSSLEALSDARRAAEIIIVDAMTGQGHPGELYTVVPEDLGTLVAADQFSLHQFSLTEAIYLVRQLGSMPPIRIYGIEPGCMAMGIGLSEPVAEAVKQAAVRIADYLRGEGHA